MKILQLCTDLRLGGIERFVLDLSQELARKGHDVILATTWSESYDQITLQNEEKPLFRRISFGKEQGCFSLGILWKMNKLIWKEKPDIVHTHLFTLCYALPSIMLGFPLKTIFVHTIHSLAEREWPTPYYRLTRFLYLHRTIPVSISSKVQESMSKRYPHVNSPLILNGSVIDTSQEDEKLISKLRSLRKTARTKIFLNIGHLSQTKNQIMLNHAAKRLADENYDFAVVIVGREDDKNYAQLFFAEKCDYVHYLGPCRHAQALLREADFFTLCSVYEGMPISLIEAIGNGCVPICTPAGGIPNACINHVNGILAFENSEDALYYAMKEALQISYDTYLQYQNASRELFSKQFSMDKCATAYENLYQQK